MKKTHCFLVSLLIAALSLSGCAGSAPLSDSATAPTWKQPNPRMANWWDKTVFYEIYVRSFKDSDGDRYGDLKGLTEKLDYLNDGNPATTTDLGIGGIWLMPIQENAPTDLHGYHVEDYYKVETDYGSKEDFLNFINEAHKRGIKVIIDHVINHTSKNHPWFLDAQKGPESPYRDWYIWSNRILNAKGPWNQAVWHSADGGKTYYFGIFNNLIPDLNYRNPAVTQEIQKISRFWMEEMKVDGFRIDASRHLLEEGNALMDHPATFQWYRDNFFPFYKKINPQAYVIGEEFAPPSKPEYRVAGEGLDMSFDSGIRDAVIAALQEGSKTKLVESWSRVLSQYPLGQVGMFLGNHDKNRIQSILDTSFPSKTQSSMAMKTAAVLLMTLPGTPYIYYGEELGLLGQGSDDNKRRAMQWDGTPGNLGFTNANKPYGIGFNQGAMDRTVAAESPDPQSLLSHYRTLISLRNSRASLQTGEMVILETKSPSVFAYLRTTGSETTLVMENLSQYQSASSELVLWNGPLGPQAKAVKLLGKGSLKQPTVSKGGGFGIWTPVENLEPGETLIAGFE